MKVETRIQTLDALRGFALLGILLMNIHWFGMPENTVEDLRIRGEFSGPNYWSWWMIEVFFHGTMRGMFSLLFGASAILILEHYAAKTSLDSAAEFFSRRLVVLFLFGLFNAYVLLWPGDILYTYALAGLFILPFYRLPMKRLLIIAGVVMVLFSVKQSWSKQKPVRMKAAADIALAVDTTVTPLTSGQKADIDTWQSFQHEHSVEHKRMVDEDQIACTQGDFWTFFAYSASISYFLETDFVYNFFFLDAFSFMLIGMALYRAGVLTGKRSKRFYIIMSAIGFAIGFPIYYLAASAKVNYGFDPYQIAVHRPWVIEQFGRLGLTLGYLGLLNLLFQLPLTAWLTRLFSPVGRLAFTNYLMQSIIGGLLFSGFAFGLFNQLERYELYYVVGAIWVFQLVFSHVWIRIFTIGPFEWLWRSATHWEWQKFERVR
ncbi:MAG: DUF418 domain-containing protein [Flavobacteriales bacterium]|jgi:uncharacterized protein